MNSDHRQFPRAHWPALPFDLWPDADVEAWNHAVARAGPLDRGGPASAFAPETHQAMVVQYGKFLAWLRHHGELDPRESPRARFTFARVSRFLRERREAASDNTIYNALGMLAMALVCMFPGEDWSWLRRHPAAPRRGEARAARRDQPRFEPGLLLHRLMVELTRIHGQPATPDTAVRQRDCVMLGVAVMTAVRRRNLLAMRIGWNLLRRPGGWELAFDMSETKMGRPIGTWLPSCLEPGMDRYLADYRPLLLGQQAPIDLVWISRRGTPLSIEAAGSAFHRLGIQLLGEHLHPHEVRHVMASTLLAHSPNAVDIAAAALTHKSSETTAEYYDLVGRNTAHSVWCDLVSRKRGARL